jgi:hypothetical protein
MDLIYANENKEDIGVLQFYQLDMAYGFDENNFELELNLEDHCIDYGYYIYAQNTEYGGLVDSIYIDNGKGIVRYSGRTWHGILAKSIIKPDQDYYVVSGEANQVVADIITRQGLYDIFKVSNENSGLYINEYSFRYVNAYDGILDMLKAYQGKISFSWQGDKIELSCSLAIDFTNDDEWDSSQMEFEISQNHRPTNHLICLGQGNLSDRAVIHLFLDENGNVQPYANENPMEDADYITDESQKVLDGVNEIADVYDYPSAEVLTTYIPLETQPDDFISNHTKYFKKQDDNYVNLEITKQEKYTVLSSQPSDWSTRFNTYYEKNGNDYEQVESISSDLYTLLASQPSDWANNYGNYYKLESGSYNSVKSVTQENYKKLSTEPKDWKKNYGEYYTFNGVDYDKASGDSKPYYVAHTGKPSDWSENYDSYYWKVPKYGIKKSNNKKGYEIYVVKSVWTTAGQMYIVDDDKVKEWKAADSSKRKKIDINKFVTYYSQYKKKPKWKTNTYYNQESKSVAPEFRTNYYYSYSSREVAPQFATNTYYSRKTVVTAPSFVANRYYSKAIVDVYESFKSNAIYRQSEDRFATLVAEGIKKLQDAFAEKDSARVDLEELQTYDVNDIVGARENITGIFIKQYITKKIIKIKNGIIDVDYTIGKE